MEADEIERPGEAGADPVAGPMDADPAAVADPAAADAAAAPEDDRVSPWRRLALTVAGLVALAWAGEVAGSQVVTTAWLVGTGLWLVLLIAWREGPIRRDAVRRGPLRTVLLVPFAVPYGIGMAMWAALELASVFA